MNDNPEKKYPLSLICVCFSLWFLVVPLIVGIKMLKNNSLIEQRQIKEKTDLESSIEQLKQIKENAQSDIEYTKQNKSELLSRYRDEAKKRAEAELLAELKDKRAELDSLISSIAASENEFSEKQEQLRKLEKSVDSSGNKLNKLKELVKSFQYAIKAYEDGNDSYLQSALEGLGDPDLLPIVEMKLNCMNVKQLKQAYNQEQRNIQEAFKRYEGRYTTKANTAIYKLMVIALEAELQNVLFSLKFGKLDDSVEAVKKITARYLSIAADGNQSIVSTLKKFIGEIEYLFIEAIKIEYEYYTQKERIKEEQRAIKEQMKQEAAERKELEAQRKKIEAEEAKFAAAISSATKQLNGTTDSEQIRLLEERIRQLQGQMDSVKDKKDKIIQLQNGKAGHVYIISNLGSFGENVFKVGMTRRQDPMDRVQELGNASVPFSFDVHSFIFTEDAVGLEAALHRELNDRRVNKINLRKEYFNVSLDEIEELVYKYHPTAEFNRTMLAEEYRKGLSMKEVSAELDEEYDDGEDD